MNLAGAREVEHGAVVGLLACAGVIGLNRLSRALEAREHGRRLHDALDHEVRAVALSDEEQATPTFYLGWLFNEHNGVEITHSAPAPMGGDSATLTPILGFIAACLTQINSRGLSLFLCATEPPSNAPDGGSPILLLGG